MSILIYDRPDKYALKIKVVMSPFKFNKTLMILE